MLLQPLRSCLLRQVTLSGLLGFMVHSCGRDIGVDVVKVLGYHSWILCITTYSFILMSLMHAAVKIKDIQGIVSL